MKSSLNRSKHKEKQSASLVQELTVMVKEQKTRIAELLKAKREAAAEFKVWPKDFTNKNVLDFVVSFADICQTITYQISITS